MLEAREEQTERLQAVFGTTRELLSDWQLSLLADLEDGVGHVRSSWTTIATSNLRNPWQWNFGAIWFGRSMRRSTNG